MLAVHASIKSGAACLGAKLLRKQLLCRRLDAKANPVIVFRGTDTGGLVPLSESVTTSAGVVARVHIRKQLFLLHARFISRWKYRFSSDQRSQATLSSVSTDVGDQSGTLSDLAFFSRKDPFFSQKCLNNDDAQFQF